MYPAIFNNDGAGREAFQKLASVAIQWIADYYQHIESFPVRSKVNPGEIYSSFFKAPSLTPVNAEEIFSVLNDKIIPGITHWQHPQFYAFFPGNTSFPSIIAEILTAGLAAQCMMWETSPAAAELEKRCMEWCRDLLGLPEYWSGVIQDTASTATLTSLLTAREWKTNFRISEEGFDGRKFRVYGTSQTHSSVEKAVRLAGLGTDNFVHIATDERLSMRSEALEAVIKTDLLKGFIPLCVVSTIGTTGTGAIDPVPAIGEVASRYKIWHHVDAAYAGSALMLDEFSKLRDGMENVDSFVFNPHKWMFVAFDCTAYFVRDPNLLIRTMRITPSYLSTVYGGRVNDYRDWGIPLGRRFRALKLWITIQMLGTDAIKDRMRHHIRLSKEIEEKINKDPILEIAFPRSFNIISFRLGKEHDPTGTLTKQLVNNINESGKAYMTHAIVEGHSIIRWVTGQTYVEPRHIDDTWSLIQLKLEQILKI